MLWRRKFFYQRDACRPRHFDTALFYTDHTPERGGTFVLEEMSIVKVFVSAFV